MANVLTLRLPPGKVARIDRRAAELGQHRSSYLRNLIDEDLRRATIPRKHIFASEDLVGCLSTGIKRGDNRTVRKIIQERLRAHRGKNR